MKIILSILLLLAVFMINSFLFFFLAFNNNFFGNVGDKYRDRFARNSVLKSVFRLNVVGDAKMSLLTGERLDILVVETGESDIKVDTTGYLKKEIGAVVRAKTVEVKTIFKESIGEKSFEELERFASYTVKSHSINKNAIVIIVLDRPDEKSTRVGLSISDRTILIYKDRINELSETRSITNDIEKSTVLHEFGHLVGLEHNKLEGCLMNETVESPGNDINSELPLTFCPYELKQIETLRNEVI